MCRPLYYAYPEADEAYTYNEEYLFGDRILATAVCEPAGADGKAARKVWFPKGSNWYDMAHHVTYNGGSVKTLYYTIGQNPWYVKAGSIIPLAGEQIASLQEKSNVLGLLVVPGAGKSAFTLYEDDGLSRDYDKRNARTLIEKNRSGNKLTLTIHPRHGSFADMPAQREVYLLLEGVTAQPKSVKCNGTAAGTCTAENACMRIDLGAVPAENQTVIEILL